MKTVVVTGCNGYIGNALVLRLLSKGYKVLGIDNDLKYKWVHEVGSVSAIPIFSSGDKIPQLEKLGNFRFYRLDITKDANEIRWLMEEHQPDTIVNLAQQPSAPFSQRSMDNSIETYTNNTIGTLTLLWLIKETDLDIHFIEIESMGCFQPEIGTRIPEGLFQFQFEGETSVPSLFPRRPGSFYHATKVNNTYLLDAANRWWGLKATAINQGIVTGAWTKEIAATGIHSSFYVDECFGTVYNRFIVQFMLDMPLTVYGKGKQKRGFLSLSDSVKCLELIIDNPPADKELRMINQLDQVWSIVELANAINQLRTSNHYDKYVNHIKDPRVECTADFPYNPSVDFLKSLGFEHTRGIFDEVGFIMKSIYLPTLAKLAPLVMPKIKW